MQTFDPLTTTAVIAYVRRRVTPTVLWSAIGALGTALVVSITWLVTMQSDMRQTKETVAESKKQVADMQQKLELLNKIDTRIAVMESRISDIDVELKRQGRKWDRVEEVADSPPHARKRR